MQETCICVIKKKPQKLVPQSDRFCSQPTHAPPLPPTLKAIDILGNTVFSDPEIYVSTPTLVLSRTLQLKPPFSQGLLWKIISIGCCRLSIGNTPGKLDIVQSQAERIILIHGPRILCTRQSAKQGKHKNRKWRGKRLLLTWGYDRLKNICSPSTCLQCGSHCRRGTDKGQGERGSN